MGAKKKTSNKPARRRGSAPGKTPTAKKSPRRAAVQPSLPGVPDGRIARLEELDAALIEATTQRNAYAKQIKETKASMVTEIRKRALPKYTTNSGFVVKATTLDKLDRTKAPKPKRERRMAA